MNPHVLVAFDESDPARRALEHAIEQHPEADVTVLTVVGEVGAVDSVADPDARTVSEGAQGDVECVPEDADGLEEVVQERLVAARRIAAYHDVEIETACEVGPPTQEIPEFAAREGVDRIVIGHHGRTGVARLVIGSVSEAVAREVDVPVTTVR